jgi:PAS domain S-box-containing protein
MEQFEMVPEHKNHPTSRSQFKNDKPDVIDSFWFEQCVHYLNDAILVTEADPLNLSVPRIVWANNVFYSLTGYKASEIIGLSPRILQGPLTDKSTLQTLLNSLEKCEVCRVEVVNYKKDGTTFWNELEVIPITNDAGNGTHFISVQRDISKRKDAEYKRNEAYNLLKNAEQLACLGSWEWEIKKDSFTMSDKWLQIHCLYYIHLAN